jgi:hypothetical protein
MKAVHRKEFCCLAVFIIAVWFLSLQGCCSSFLSGGHRGRLSDAMEKASDDYEGEREVETEDDWQEDESEVETVISEDYSSTSLTGQSSVSPADSSNQMSGKVFSMSGGPGLLSGEDFYGYHHANLGFGLCSRQLHIFQLYVGYMWVPVSTTGTLHRSLNNGVLLLQAGAEIKYFMTPHYTFMGQYFIGGLAIHYMFWSYKNTIYADGESINSDSMSGFELYAGVGINLMQTRYFQLGGECLPGMILWSKETRRGFENDVFGPFWHIKLRINVNFIKPE